MEFKRVHFRSHLGPTEVLLKLSLDFTSDIDADSVEAAISELEIEINRRFPVINWTFIAAQSAAGPRRAPPPAFSVL